MVAWTPEQIKELVTEVTALVVALGATLKALHDTKSVSINAQNNAQNSVPIELAHKMVDNAAVTQAATAGGGSGTTVNVPAPAEVTIKEEGN